jgi:hypothetical protein
MRVAARFSAEDGARGRQHVRRDDARFGAIKIDVPQVVRRLAQLNADVLPLAVEMIRGILRYDADVLPAWTVARLL